MKLNPDCIRDLMLFMEEKTCVVFCDNPSAMGSKFAAYHELCPALFHDIESLRKYSMAEIFYHVVQLAEDGYIVTDYKFDPHKDSPIFSLSRVYSITPKGHKFISDIADEKRWSNKVKPIANALGSVSLAVLESVASGVTSAALNSISLC